MSARKPKIEYYWTTTKWAARLKKPTTVEVNWRLVSANGETMCQSTQGFRDKTDAQRSVAAVSTVFAELVWVEGKPVLGFREVGPGRKPS